MSRVLLDYTAENAKKRSENGYHSLMSLSWNPAFLVSFLEPSEMGQIPQLQDIRHLFNKMIIQPVKPSCIFENLQKG